MIKANELRIGNYAIIGGIEQKMQQCHFNEYVNENGYFVYITPIILTDQWFKNSNLLNGIFRDNEYFSISKSFNFDSYFVNFNDEFTASYVKYVHELQNVYFALTGEELIF